MYCQLCLPSPLTTYARPIRFLASRCYSEPGAVPKGCPCHCLPSTISWKCKRPLTDCLRITIGEGKERARTRFCEQNKNHWGSRVRASFMRKVMTRLFSIVLIELKGVCHTPLLLFLVTLLFARIPILSTHFRVKGIRMPLADLDLLI